MQEIIKISITDLLNNLDKYEGQIVEVTANLVVFDYHFCFLKENNPYSKIRPDNRCIFVTIPPSNIKSMFGYSFTHLVKSRKQYLIFECTMRGKIEKLDWTPMPAMLSNITYVRAEEPYYLNPKIYEPNYDADVGYIHKFSITFGQFEGYFLRRSYLVRSKWSLSVPIREISDNFVELSSYEGNIDALVGSNILITGILVFHHDPSYDKSWRVTYALKVDKLQNLGESSNLIWIRPDSYSYLYSHRAYSKMMTYGGPSSNLVARMIGRLQYTYDDGIIPIDLSQLPRLVIEDLQVVILYDIQLSDYVWG